MEDTSIMQPSSDSTFLQTALHEDLQWAQLIIILAMKHLPGSCILFQYRLLFASPTLSFDVVVLPCLGIPSLGKNVSTPKDCFHLTMQKAMLVLQQVFLWLRDSVVF